MPELPHRGFVLLSPPEGGCADARRRGQARRIRRACAVSGAALAATAVLTLAMVPLSPSAADRLDPAPYGGDRSSAPPGTSVAPTPPAAPVQASGGAQPTGPRADAGAPPYPAVVPVPAPARRDEPQSSTTPPAAAGVGAQAEPAAPAVSRSYQPPDSGGVQLCAAAARVAPSGPTGAEVRDWCQVLRAEPVPEGHRLVLSVCRSSDAGQGFLHVDRGRQLALRVAERDRDRWRLPQGPGARGQEALPTEPGGCWVWAYRWNGTDAAGRPLPPGRYAAYGRSLAEEVRGLSEHRDELEVE